MDRSSRQIKDIKKKITEFFVGNIPDSYLTCLADDKTKSNQNKKQF